MYTGRNMVVVPYLCTPFDTRCVDITPVEFAFSISLPPPPKNPDKFSKTYRSEEGSNPRQPERQAGMLTTGLPERLYTLLEINWFNVDSFNNCTTSGGYSCAVYKVRLVQLCRVQHQGATAMPCTTPGWHGCAVYDIRVAQL